MTATTPLELLLARALERIANYQDPEEIREETEQDEEDNDYRVIGADETIEMAYENVLFEARNALKAAQELSP